VANALKSRSLPPPLKWAGGKRWLVPRLLPHWKRFSERRLVEPFCGALGVTLGLMPERALLNDLNPHLMHFLSSLQRGLVVRAPENEVHGDPVRFLMETEPVPQNGEQQENAGEMVLQETFEIPASSEVSPNAEQVVLPMAYDETLYYRHRGRFNELLRTGGEQTPEAAALFYYLNRTGFNGLCRFNGSGEFNVPFGKYSRVTYTRDFTLYRQLFASWELMSVDFEALPLEAGDFIYADPPYDVEFTQYSKEAFGWEEQVRAAEWLTRHDGPVILSNQATNRIVALYQKLGFRLEYIEGPRRISCTGDRSPAKELLAFRNITQE
jgi:DNA adenine methylase